MYCKICYRIHWGVHGLKLIFFTSAELKKLMLKYWKSTYRPTLPHRENHKLLFDHWKDNNHWKEQIYSIWQHMGKSITRTKWVKMGLLYFNLFILCSLFFLHSLFFLYQLSGLNLNDCIIAEVSVGRKMGVWKVVKLYTRYVYVYLYWTHFS